MTIKPTLTQEQFAACRLLVARLRSEAAGEWFDFKDIGMSWLETDDPVVVTVEDGSLIRSSDLFYGAMILLWSMVVARSNDKNMSPPAVIADLGLHLAMIEP